MLSDTVGNALQLTGNAEYMSAIDFVKTFNKAFDCLNVKSFGQGVHSRNVNLMQYSSSSDERLKVNLALA